MYFDDLELEKLQMEMAREGWCDSGTGDEQKRSPGTIRKCHSVTDFNKMSQQNLNNSFSPCALLCYSVVSRDIELLSRLVAVYPLAVNELTEHGVSALHLAALDGNIDIIKFLVGVNADINLLDNNGRSVLDYAVQSGQFDASQYLIGCGSDLTRVRDGLVF